MSKGDLIKFYAYLDNNNMLYKKYRNGVSLVDTIKNFIKTLPHVEASRVSENEQQRNVCINTECHANDFSECNLKAGSCEDRQT